MMGNILKKFLLHHRQAYCWIIVPNAWYGLYKSIQSAIKSTTVKTKVTKLTCNSSKWAGSSFNTFPKLFWKVLKRLVIILNVPMSVLWVSEVTVFCWRNKLILTLYIVYIKFLWIQGRLMCFITFQRQKKCIVAQAILKNMPLLTYIRNSFRNTGSKCVQIIHMIQ